MRSYDQYCSMARALDLVGDRWTLLIVRELLTQGPCRYRDLQRGLPGIATNLLATRLRAMEDSGLIERHELPAPVGATVVELTDRGRDLSGVVRELTRWGAPEMLRYAGTETFRGYWLTIPARHFLADHDPSGPPVRVRFGDLPDALDVCAAGGALDVGVADPRHTPEATVTGTPPLVVGVITGRVPLALARAGGLAVDGDEAMLARILPRTAGS